MTRAPEDLVLASSSPRRVELLRHLGLPFRVLAPDVDEEAASAGRAEPAAIAAARAAAKVAAGLAQAPGGTVIAADTLVVCDGAVLGKPGGPADAERMLRLLAGRSHAVITALAVGRGGDVAQAVEYATVTFRPLQEEEIRRYAASAEPLDKAGGYGLQGAGALFVSRIEGEYGTVVGLPLCRLGLMLRALGCPLPAEPGPGTRAGGGSAVPM
jgi:septum formation protein